MAVHILNNEPPALQNSESLQEHKLCCILEPCVALCPAYAGSDFNASLEISNQRLNDGQRWVEGTLKLQGEGRGRLDGVGFC